MLKFKSFNETVDNPERTMPPEVSNISLNVCPEDPEILDPLFAIIL